jgi:two-component system probable response regulator PhcQ
MLEPQTVLLVDDDPHLLTALRRALRFEPYQLRLAESAAAALWLLETTPVDVLVTDQRMPGMSGAEFLTRVRAEHPHVVSIMLTGHADVATAISAINSGEVYRFFTKPCDAASLAVAIRQALQLKALIRQTRRLLGTVRRQAVALAPYDANGLQADDADDPAPAHIYEVDAAPVDLDALLREIEAELEAAERREDGRPRGGPAP